MPMSLKIADRGTSVPGFSESNTALDTLLERYEVRQPAQARTFLQRNPSTAIVLSEAIEPIEAVFGAGAVVALSVIGDQESEPEMSALVRVEGSVERAKSLRREFYRNWWLPTVARDRVPLTFNVDVV
jgi:hypothetical protein